MEIQKYKVKRPIGWGGRVEVGEIIEMTEEQFKAFGDEYLEPIAEVATATKEKVEIGEVVKPRKRIIKSKK